MKGGGGWGGWGTIVTPFPAFPPIGKRTFEQFVEHTHTYSNSWRALCVKQGQYNVLNCMVNLGWQLLDLQARCGCLAGQ
eukprot:scaffold159652_cov19-Tisochrysis_lutea.AAC.1